MASDDNRNRGRLSSRSRGSFGGSGDSLSGIAGSVSRYDLLLAVIPTAFLLAALVGELFAVGHEPVIAGASAVGALAVLDGLFVNPPRSGSRPG